MTKRKKKAPAEPRKPLNFGVPSRTDPESWGPPQKVYRFDETGRLRPTMRGPQQGYFAYLIDHGELTSEQVQAGQEIERCYRALVSDAMCRTQRFERVDRSYNSDWAESLRIAIATRYGPWRDRMTIWHVKERRPGHALVIDAVVECRSLNEMALDHGKRKATIKALLIEALQEYCRMAGWERKPARIRASG
jgi:hypothetical protein